MTDNDDSAPSRDRPSRSGSAAEERHGDVRADDVRAVISISSEKGAQAAPTDPEVPSAKRRGALRQKRVLAGLAAVVVGLLSITLAVLYRAGQRVGIPDRADPAASSRIIVPHESAPARPQLDTTEPTTRANPPSMPSRRLDDTSPFGDGAAPVRSSPFPISPPAASGIIRAPSF
jgi:hypothetical protein